MMGIGAELYEEMVKAGREGLHEWAEKIHDDAVANMPVGDPAQDPDEAVALAASGRIDLDEGGDSVVLSFTTPYAAKQHEAQHFEHPRGGDAKYLERAVIDNFREGEQLIASKVRARLAAPRRH